MKNLYLIAILTILFSCKNKEVKTEEPKEAPIENTIIEKEEISKEKAAVLIFTVQIAALIKKNTSLSSVEDIKIYEENGLIKYRLGEFKTYQEARDYRKVIIRNYKDAFIQALKNGNPIHITEALNN